MRLHDRLEKLFTKVDAKFAAALEAGDTDEALRLTRLGAKSPFIGYSSLTLAAKHGRASVVAAILDENAFAQEKLVSAMIEAVESGDVETADVIRKRGVSIEGCEFNLFDYAANGEGVKMLQFLISHGATPKYASIHRSAYEGRAEMARFLMDHGYADAQDTRTAALYLAIRDGQRHMIPLFIEYGADIHDRYVIHNAATEPKIQPLMDAIELGADITKCDAETLKELIRCNRVERVPFLVERGAKFDFANIAWQRMSDLLERGHNHMFVMLMAHGAGFIEPGRAEITKIREDAQHKLLLSLKTDTAREALLTKDGKATQLLLAAFVTGSGAEIVTPSYWPKREKEGVRLWNDIAKVLPAFLKATAYDPVDTTALWQAAGMNAPAWQVRLATREAKPLTTERR